MGIAEGKATIRNSSLRTLIGLASTMDASQVRGGSWLDEPSYDIEATSSIAPSHNHLVAAAIYRSLLSMSQDPLASPSAPAPVKPVTEALWGKQVTDNYRYMEALDPQTIAWMKAQGAYTRSVLDAIPRRA